MDGKAQLETIARVAGGKKALAQLLGRPQQTVWDWIARGRVPVDAASAVAQVAASLTPPVHVDPAVLAGLPRPQAREAA